jgi:hypothetical protein
VLARPGAGRDHTFGGALAEAAGHEDAVGVDDLVPSGEELGGLALLAFRLEVVGIDPSDVELPPATHGRVL